MIVHLKLLLTAVFWGGTFIAGRITAASVSPFSAAFLRFAIASTVLILMTVKLEGGLPKIRRGHVPHFLVLGLSGVFLYNVFFFSGLKLIPAGRAALIIALNPIAIALLAAACFDDAIGGLRWVGIIISVLGALIVVTDGDLASVFGRRLGWGEGFIFGCVLSWAAFTIVGRPITAEMSPLVIIAYASVIGALGLLPPAIHEGLLADIRGYHARDWLSLSYLGIFGTAVGFVWYYEGIKALGPAIASQYINFVPASAVLLAFFVLDEPITPPLAAGVVCVVVGVYLVNSAKNRWRHDGDD